MERFINSYKFAPGEKLNIVAHSHGANVVLLAAYYLRHTVDNLVTLGTPVNFDILPYESKANIKNYCAVSSYTDPVETAGSSPLQLGQIAAWTTTAVQDQQSAIEAAVNDDWAGYWFYEILAAYDADQANLWYL